MLATSAVRFDACSCVCVPVQTTTLHVHHSKDCHAASFIAQHCQSRRYAAHVKASQGPEGKTAHQKGKSFCWEQGRSCVNGGVGVEGGGKADGAEGEGGGKSRWR